MISRKNRFHGHGSLRHVYQHGQVVRGPWLSIKFVSNNRRSTYRLAVVVSKKTAKSAVVRNRIRRRLYEIFRSSVPAGSNYDIVLSVFDAKTANMPADELKASVLKLLKQAKIITSDGSQP